MTLRFALLAGVAVLVAGCASVTSGSGSVVSPPTSPPSSASTSQVPASSAASSPPETPPSSTSSAPTESCASTADYCDDFSDASSGWPVDNEQNYFANYDRYLGGTYRMGERSANGKTELAPIDTTTISSDYGVQIDVDAVLGKKAPTTAYLGVVCWDHETSGGAEAGFLFFVTADSVDVTLLPDAGGEPQTLNQNEGGNFVRPYPATNHLTATCIQKHVAGGTSADLTLAVNGAAVLHEQYANSVKNYSWSPGSRAGLLVAGEKSDVFYDNFSITGK